MKVGFTGTQQGLTHKQSKALDEVLLAGYPITEFHHGDCIGADKEACDKIASAYGHENIVCHPPTNISKRAYVRSGHYRDAKAYLDRNHDIVDETGILIGCPKESQEVLRSGTWATIRYAMKTGKLVIIVYPDGSLADDVSFKQN